MNSFKMILVIIAIFAMIFCFFHVVHPILILTIGDMFWILIIDMLASAGLSMYLCKDNGSNWFIWFLVGIATFCLVPIIFAVVKFNKPEKK